MGRAAWAWRELPGHRAESHTVDEGQQKGEIGVGLFPSPCRIILIFLSFASLHLQTTLGCLEHFYSKVSMVFFFSFSALYSSNIRIFFS